MATEALAMVEETAAPSLPARILLVDDDERNLLALSHVLKEVADVVTATSGREALRQLLNGDFAVILLDVYMPGMDGYEVASLIRQREQTARIPIIFLSAVNKETEHLMRGYAMGAVDYVFKPVDPMILTSKVSVFVDLYEMRRQLAAQNRAEQDLREANFRTELKRLQIENELQATRARQSAILDVLPLALFEARLDAQGALVRHFVGGNLGRIVGSDAMAIHGGEIRWEERIDPQDLTELRVPVLPSARQTMAHSYRWRGSDGIVRHFIEQCELDAHASELRWAGTLIDVTERKQLEAQLLQVGKIEAIGKLTGGVAHDFNNLLAIIMGGVDLLERRVSFEPRDQMIVEHIRQAVDKGADLVRRMLAFARKQDLSPVSINPAAICDAVAGLVQQTLGGTITIEWACMESKRNFFADRSQLELALLNLIINARDAMPDGGTIQVEMKEADADLIAAADLPGPAYFAITVADQGTGIPPELIDKIIEPFFTTKEVGKGTGLGLSMVMGFVQQSGGKLSIESEHGRGTIVQILLPATDEAAYAASNDDDIDEQHCSVRSILLVDDEDAVRTMLGEQLRDLGVAVVEAASGKEALAMLDGDRQFDLILSDFAMPRINGLQTINEARRLVPDIRAALMTGYADDRLDAIDGAVRVLYKPVSLVDLKRLLI